MDNIKQGFFEIFTHIIPGFFIFIGITLILDNKTSLVNFIVEKANETNVQNSILLLLSCYILGFKFQYVAYEVFKPLSKLIWRKRMGQETSFNKLEAEITQIRHFSPNNFESLQKWFALRGMCYGLFLSILFLNFILIWRSLQNCFWSNERIVLILLFFILAILFLRRAVTFHEWANQIITNSIKHLKEFKKYGK